MELLVLKTNVLGLVEEGPVAARLWLRWEANCCTGDLETTVWSATRTPPLERLSSTSSYTSAVNVSSSAEDNVRCLSLSLLSPPLSPFFNSDSLTLSLHSLSLYRLVRGLWWYESVCDQR
jgi:hypothetical protein